MDTRLHVAEKVFNKEDRNLSQGSAAPGMARATLRDLGALSHRSDQGRRVTDACPGTAFRVRVLMTHAAKVEERKTRANGGKEGGRRLHPVKHLTSRDKFPRTTTSSVRK